MHTLHIRTCTYIHTQTLIHTHKDTHVRMRTAHTYRHSQTVTPISILLNNYQQKFIILVKFNLIHANIGTTKFFNFLDYDMKLC